MCYKKEAQGRASSARTKRCDLHNKCQDYRGLAGRSRPVLLAVWTADENSSGVRNPYDSSLVATGLPLSSFRMKAKFTDDRWSGGGAEAKLLASSRRGGGVGDITLRHRALSRSSLTKRRRTKLPIRY